MSRLWSVNSRTLFHFEEDLLGFKTFQDISRTEGNNKEQIYGIQSYSIQRIFKVLLYILSLSLLVHIIRYKSIIQ